MSLFAERAQMARDDFALTDETLPQVRHICQLVDGSPLGIALAAAWVRRRSLAQIGAGIAQSLDFLTTRLRDVDQRHRSMRAVFEASWALLAADEQAVLAALSIFPASFDADAAQAIAGAGLFELDGLCEKSLVQQDAAAERYSLHSLVRQFAAEKLGEGTAAVADIDRAFVAYFYQFAQTERDNYEALQPEWRNLDTAVSKAHALADWATVLGLVAALDEPWFRQIRFAEMRAGLRLAVAAAEQVGDEAALARWLLRLGEVEVELNDYGAAAEHLARAERWLLRLEDGLGLAQVKYLHGRVQVEQGQSEPAQQHLAEAKRLYEAEEAWADVAKTLNLSALCHLTYSIDLQLARTKLEQSLAVQSQLAPSIVYVEALRYLARIEGVFEAYEQAEAHLREAADVAQAQR
ncbi:MAG: hypothetical protein KDD89_15415, partial [Anaerolineales bacterium]|nr:hypothetical protein [Anaerolineales bacterium]